MRKEMMNFQSNSFKLLKNQVIDMVIYFLSQNLSKKLPYLTNRI